MVEPQQKANESKSGLIMSNINFRCIMGLVTNTHKIFFLKLSIHPFTGLKMATQLPTTTVVKKNKNFYCHLLSLKYLSRCSFFTLDFMFFCFCHFNSNREQHGAEPLVKVALTR